MMVKERRIILGSSWFEIYESSFLVYLNSKSELTLNSFLGYATYGFEA